MVLDWLTEGQNLQRLATGLWLTAKISFVSVGISCITGVLFGLLMRAHSKIIRVACQFYLETIRIVPILVWLFVLYFGLPTWSNIHLDGVWVCVLPCLCCGAQQKWATWYAAHYNPLKNIK